jgi:hypothetical protein
VRIIPTQAKCCAMAQAVQRWLHTLLSCQWAFGAQICILCLCGVPCLHKPFVMSPSDVKHGLWPLPLSLLVVFSRMMHYITLMLSIVQWPKHHSDVELDAVEHRCDVKQAYASV